MSAEAAALPLPPRPDAFARLAEAVADRVNPIVVKEMRQGLRTRVFWIFFGLMLLACLVISLIAVATAEDGSSDTGAAVFFAYFVCLALVQFFVIPYSAYRSMAREREEETWVLLTLTGLPPRRVLAGKLGSFVLQGSLYASAAAPFLLFSYYLNGIDLPSIGLAMAMATAYQVFLTAIGVSAATLADSRLVRALVHFLLLGWLLMTFGWGLTWAFGVSTAGRSLASGDAFWLGSLFAVFSMLTTGVLLFEAAAARLSLPTEPYARGPRLAFLVQTVAGVGFGLAFWQQVHEDEVLMIAAVLGTLYVTFVGLLVSSDRDGMAKNHRVARGPWLLKPGALPGFVLVVLVLLLLAGVNGAAAVAGSGVKDNELAVIVTAPGFAVLYLAAAHVVARWIPHPPYQTPAMVRLVFLGLFIAGTAAPPLLGEVLSQPDDRGLNLLNPAVGLANLGRGGLDEALASSALVWALAAAAGVWATVVLVRRDGERGP